MSAENVTVDLIRTIPLFDDLAHNHQEQIARISHFRKISKGEEIFHEGDPRDCLYVVLEGRVALEIHIPNRGRLRILTIEPMEVLGWSSMANVTQKRTATARAVASGRLLAVDADQLQKACSEDAQLGYVIMNHVANVIANRLIATRMQLLDMFSNPAAEAPHG